MALTPENLETLRRKFTLNEHEFTRGYAYITESAVTTRIEEVDPAWSWVIINEWVRDNQAICIGRLTIGDISRDGVGMQPLTIKSTKTGEILEGTEPEKSAATDALKRAARLFGIGRYLLDLPGSVKDMNTLALWLNNGEQGERRLPVKSQMQTLPSSGEQKSASTQAPLKNSIYPGKFAGEMRTDSVSTIFIENVANKSRYKTASECYAFNRDVFRVHIPECENWPKGGKITLSQPFNVISEWVTPEKQGGFAYWKITKVEPMGAAESDLFPAPAGAGEIDFS